MPSESGDEDVDKAYHPSTPQRASATDHDLAIIRSLRSLARFRTVRFLIDFWFDPPAAWRRYAQKREWPTPREFGRMSDEDFGAYLEAIGARRPVPVEGGQEDAVSGELLAGVRPGAEEAHSGGG